MANDHSLQGDIKDYWENGQFNVMRYCIDTLAKSRETAQKKSPDHAISELEGALAAVYRFDSDSGHLHYAERDMALQQLSSELALLLVGEHLYQKAISTLRGAYSNINCAKPKERIGEELEKLERRFRDMKSNRVTLIGILESRGYGDSIMGASSIYASEISVPEQLRDGLRAGNLRDYLKVRLPAFKITSVDCSECLDGELFDNSTYGLYGTIVPSTDQSKDTLPKLVIYRKQMFSEGETTVLEVGDDAWGSTGVGTWDPEDFINRIVRGNRIPTIEYVSNSTEFFKALEALIVNKVLS